MGMDLTRANARYRLQRIFADIDVAVAVDKLPFAFVDSEDGEIGVGARCHAAQHAFRIRVRGRRQDFRVAITSASSSPMPSDITFPMESI